MSTNGRNVSLKTVVERVFMDFGFSYALTYVEAAEWAGSILTLLKAPVTMSPKTEVIHIKNGRGKLPCDLETITQTAKMDGIDSENCKFVPISHLDFGTAVVPVSLVDITNKIVEGCFNCDGNVIPFDRIRLTPMRWSTDSFHGNYHNTTLDWRINSNFSYQVNDNYIFTNFKHGKCLMSYRAIAMDDEGFPLIPHEEHWRNAVKWELAYKVAFKLYMSDQLTRDKFQIIERDRDWYISQAVNQSNMFTNTDEAESFINQNNRLLPIGSGHDNFFRNISAPENIKNQPITRW
jgi:hypothetical protein